MTQIDYPDIIRTSPSGRLVLEIRSPDNDESVDRDATENGPRSIWGGFQRDFIFAVRDRGSGQTLWERAPGNESFLDEPCAAWIGDCGHVVVITRNTFFSHLFVLAPTGETALHLDVAGEILEGHADELHWTSAGPHWNEHGAGLFFEWQAETYWSFRTQMNRQVLINLSRRELTPATGGLRERLQAVQSDWALQTLRAAADDPRLCIDELEERDDWEFKNAAWIAAYWCGLDRLSAASEHLFKLERSTVSSGYTLGWPMPQAEETLLVLLALVPVAQNALRCLNHEPAGFAPYWLCHSRRDPPTRATRLPIPECLPDRPQRLDRLRPGMSAAEVVMLAGMHDFRGSWDYDLLNGTHGPCTIRIEWDRQTERVQQITTCPPAWLDLVARSNWL